MSDNWVLYQKIAAQIQRSSEQQITFAKFMELALYDPQDGYYSTAAVRMGRSGDFLTSPHLGPDFAELLVNQLLQCWQILGCPQPFTLLEMGAGQGLLAEQILSYLQRQYPDLLSVWQYQIIEQSAQLKAMEQQRLPDSVQWLTWNDIPEQSLVGCCISNELVDALPVHCVTLQQGRLQEIYVTLAKPHTGSLALPGAVNFVEQVGELSTPRLAQYFTNLGIDWATGGYIDGYRTEVNLAAIDWLKTLASKLKQGYVFTIDYGYMADRYYSPNRSQGTLQCYYQHQHHNNPYLYLGNQDITAHVDFTTLIQTGQQCGLEKVGWVEQGLFLMALGLGDRLSDLATQVPPLSLQEILQRRDNLHSLINPMGLGRFGVLVQARALNAQQRQIPLKGLAAAA